MTVKANSKIWMVSNYFPLPWVANHKTVIDNYYETFKWGWPLNIGIISPQLFASMLSPEQSRITAGRLPNYNTYCDGKGVGDGDKCRAASLISASFSGSNFWTRHWYNLLYYSVIDTWADSTVSSQAGEALCGALEFHNWTMTGCTLSTSLTVWNSHVFTSQTMTHVSDHKTHCGIAALQTGHFT